MGRLSLLTGFPGLTTALGILLLCVSWRALSNEQPAAEAAHRIPVATLDVAKVFKNYREFNESMNFTKSKVEEFDREVRFRQEQLKKQAAGQNAQAGAEESDRKKAMAEAVLNVDIAAKKKEFLLTESRVYFETYQAVEKVVTRLCQARDIGVVIRCQRDPFDPADRNSVLSGVNRPIIYSVVPDLTDDVIAELNR